jgi:SAM-dependent methyltransferase
MDWDSAYRHEAGFEGPPPWNIGEPQPELAALAAAGKFRSDVLDAGCGYAELSLALAADGYTVHGVDLTPTAIAVATKAAEERGLSNATFEQADITTFSGHDGRFNTVVAVTGEVGGYPRRRQPKTFAVGQFLRATPPSQPNAALLRTSHRRARTPRPRTPTGDRTSREHQRERCERSATMTSTFGTGLQFAGRLRRDPLDTRVNQAVGCLRSACAGAGNHCGDGPLAVSACHYDWRLLSP